MSAPFLPRGTRSEVEEGLGFMPKFDKDGLITAIAVDAASSQVLMVAYMNQESLAMTLEKGEAVYWSRSRQELWHKGATSGAVQRVIEVLTDCDQDALVLRVEQAGGAACHSGRRSCFYRRVVDASTLAEVDSERLFDPAEVYGKKG